MNIYLGADHRGFYLKEQVFGYLAKHHYEVQDVGNEELDPSDDYPEFAQIAALKIIGDSSKDSTGILLCGDGQGMAITANRFRGIRAIVAWDANEARIARRDLDANILCVPARLLEDQDDGVWQGIIETWLATPYSGAARHSRRISQIDEVR